MIEKISRALCESIDLDPDKMDVAMNSGGVERPNWTSFTSQAKTALTAMLEPTEDMIHKGNDCHQYSCPEGDVEEYAGVEASYKAMITQALGEDE